MNAVNSVLIVDDEPAVRDIMTRWVASLGLQSRSAASADEALETLRTRHYDLAVIDVLMPGHDGLWLAGELKRNHPQTAVVIATAYTSLLESENRDVPIADLLVKPFAKNRFVLAIDRGRQWRKRALEEVRWHAQLGVEMNDRAEAVCAELVRATADGRNAFDTLVGLARERMPETHSHSERVARFAESVVCEMGLAVAVREAALLHDIGKLAIPESLLDKPSPLTPGEFAIMRRHVDTGVQLLTATHSLEHLAPAVHASHEWFNGGGYPRKLAGADIPPASRVIGVCDAYDAMTQGRLYCGAVDASEAVAELLRCSNTQFDPDVVAAFLAVLGRH